ncbi:hypothetical protein AB1N83_003442 [Pleurotus pulmonarius]
MLSEDTCRMELSPIPLPCLDARIHVHSVSMKQTGNGVSSFVEVADMKLLQRMLSKLPLDRSSYVPILSMAPMEVCYLLRSRRWRSLREPISMAAAPILELRIRRALLLCIPRQIVVFAAPVTVIKIWRQLFCSAVPMILRAVLSRYRSTHTGFFGVSLITLPASMLALERNLAMENASPVYRGRFVDVWFGETLECRCWMRLFMIGDTASSLRKAFDIEGQEQRTENQSKMHCSGPTTRIMMNGTIWSKYDAPNRASSSMLPTPLVLCTLRLEVELDYQHAARIEKVPVTAKV